MSDIMRQIKQELGDDAVIISNRTLDDGTLRVSAAVEEDLIELEDDVTGINIESVEDSAALFSGIKDYDILPDENFEQKINLISKSLSKHSVPSFLHEKIMAVVEQNPFGSVLDCLSNAFDHVFSFSKVPLGKNKSTFMLVGQPGSGKTTTIAKLATQSTLNQIETSVITADTTKAGAIEQLAAFTRVLKLDLLKVSTPEQLKRAIKDAEKSKHIFIDCPGINAFDPDSMKELHSFIKVTEMDLIVVIPGGIDVEEAAEIARAFAIIGAKYLLPTRIDMSRRLGGLLAAADQAKLSFIAMGNRPDIASGLESLDSKKLAELILPRKQGGVS